MCFCKYKCLSASCSISTCLIHLNICKWIQGVRLYQLIAQWVEFVSKISLHYPSSAPLITVTEHWHAEIFVFSVHTELKHLGFLGAYLTGCNYLHHGGRREEISRWSAEPFCLTLGGIIHVRFNLAEFLPLLSHKLLLASCCRATPDRNPHAEKFTLSQQEIEPFASMFAREKLKGKVTFRKGLLCPNFVESSIALVGERQALRGLLPVAKACRDTELQRAVGSNAIVQDSNRKPISC